MTMVIPKTLAINCSVECNNCDAVTTVSGKLYDHANMVQQLRELLGEKGWLPLMLGKACVGVLCKGCVRETLETDEAEDEDSPTKLAAIAEAEQRQLAFK